MLNSSGPSTEPCGILKFARYSDSPDLGTTLCLRPIEEVFIHRNTVLEKPMSRSFLISIDGDMVSKALLKSNNSSKVTNLSLMPTLMSSLSFRRAV